MPDDYNSTKVKAIKYYASNDNDKVLVLAREDGSLIEVPVGGTSGGGTAGPAGPQGIQGIQGVPGNDGGAGPQGVPGPQGPAGADGAAGAQGPAGAVGPAGPQGAAGAAGAAGAQGPAGAAGAAGAQGPAGAPGAGGLLAVIEWNPFGMQTRVSPSAGLADFDADNLAIAFVAPPSGAVLVKLNAMCSIADPAAYARWGLKEGGATLTSGFNVTKSVDPVRCELPILITGLVPGSNHTYKWAGSTSDASYIARLFAGITIPTPQHGPASMSVWAAP